MPTWIFDIFKGCHGGMGEGMLILLSDDIADLGVIWSCDTIFMGLGRGVMGS